MLAYEQIMKRAFKGSSLLMLSILLCSAHAQKHDEKKKNTKAKKTASSKSSTKPVHGQTIGEVLKSIERKNRDLEIKKASQVLPSLSKQQVAPRQQLNLKAIKPPSRSSMYYEAGTNEAELEKVTDQGIKQLFKLTQQFKNSQRRGELWLRLAELYVEKARLIEFKLQQEYDKEVKKFNEGTSKTRPSINLKPSQDYNLKAIQLYEAFLNDFPKDPKVDQALFFLGYNYFELNKADKGRTFYERLVKEHPQSSYIEESYFALGEYHFDRNEWDKALNYYQKISSSKRNRLSSFAQYKEAWCLYKVGKQKQALLALEKVIEAGRASKQEKNSAGGVSRIRLATEATRDLVVFYAEAGSAEEARSYFESITDDKNVQPMLERLAYYYSDTGSKDSARYLFKQLIESNPNGAKAFDYQYQIVQMYTFSGSPKIFKEELYNWINNYGPESRWYAANKKNADVGEKSQQLIETTLRNYILQQHQTAQNSKQPHSQKLAKEGYELYFKTFKNGLKMDELHFFFGELLFETEDFAGAAENYNWVVDHAPKSQYFEKSSLNAVLALEKMLPKPEEMKKKVADNTSEAVPMEKTVTDFIKAGERYISLKPQDEAAVAIRYKIGSLYYYHNEFDKALAVFDDILNKHPKTQYAEFSANLMLDIYNLKKDYSGLETAGQKILSIPELSKTSVAGQVQNILQRTSFKKAQDLEGGKDFAKAAKSYEEFAQKNPGTELGMNATFNAAVNYERAGDIGKAVSLYTVVLNSSQNKNEAMKNNVRKFLGALYEKTGQYKKAADSFADYASKNPKDKEAVSFHFNAAVIYDGLNEYRKAAENYNKYFELSRAADRKEVFYLLAKMDDRRGQAKAAIENYDKYIKSGPSESIHIVESAFRIGELNQQRRQADDAETAFRRTVAISKRFASNGQPAGVQYAAEAKFNLVYKNYDELKAIRIPNNPAEQGKAVQNKLAILNRLKEQLKEVISYDDGPMVVASLALIGQAYQHMASSVFAAPIPKGLDEAGIKQYRAGIEQVAKPFQEEAIKNYEAAIQKGFQLAAYNKWLKTAQRELSILAPDKTMDRGEKAMPILVVDSGESSSKHSELRNAFKLKNEIAMLRAANQILGQNGSDLEALNTLAVFYKDEGKLGLSYLILVRALKDHQGEAMLHNNIGVVLQLQKQDRMAQGSFRKAIELNNKQLEALMNLGSMQTEYGDAKAGVDTLAMPFKSKGKDAGLALANNYAVNLSRTGQLDKAKKIFEEYTEKSSNVPSAVWLNYAILLIERQKDYKDGQRPLNKARFNSDDPSIQRRVEELDSRMRSKQ